MPRKKSPLESFHIRRFTGIETKVGAIEQQLGTLRRADATNAVPLGEISFGPNWQSAFGLSNLATQITAALSGADVTKVHFVTVAGGGSTFLVAWDLANARPQGIWNVTGNGSPFAVAPTVSTVAPQSSNHTEKITFTGGAVPRSVTIIDLARSTGDRCVIDCILPAVAGIAISFFDNAAYTAAGAALAVFTTDGSALSATLEFVFNSAGAWEYLEAQAPS